VPELPQFLRRCTSIVSLWIANVRSQREPTNRRFTDEDFCARGTGAIGRLLMAELLAKGHALVALTIGRRDRV